jgi:hypothetical protein
LESVIFRLIKVAQLMQTLEAQFAASAKLEAAIRENLRGLG